MYYEKGYDKEIHGGKKKRYMGIRLQGSRGETPKSSLGAEDWKTLQREGNVVLKEEKFVEGEGNQGRAHCKCKGPEPETAWGMEGIQFRWEHRMHVEKGQQGRKGHWLFKIQETKELWELIPPCK